MAITSTTNSTWEKVFGKQKKLNQVLATGKAGIFEVSVAITASTTYSTNGVVVDLSDGGRFDNIVTALVVDSQGFVAAYIPDATRTATGGKLKLWGEEQVSGATTPGPVLNELANSSSAIQNLTFKFLVIAY